MSTDQEPVLTFMVLRAPETVPSPALRRRYIHDDTLVSPDQNVVRRAAVDLHTEKSPSRVGRIVHTAVHCCPEKNDTQDGTTGGGVTDDGAVTGPATAGEVIDRRVPQGTGMVEAATVGGRTPEVMSDITVDQSTTDDPAPDHRPADAPCVDQPRTEAERLAALVDALLAEGTVHADPCAPGGVYTHGPVLVPYPLEHLDHYTRIIRGGKEHLVTDRLELLPPQALLREIAAARPLLDREREAFDLDRLTTALEALFRTRLRDLVLAADGGHTSAYRNAKRTFFDALYRLYVLRRVAPALSLEHLIAGLRTLHVLEALALDQVVAESVRSGRVDGAERALLAALAADHPGLRGWTLCGPPDGFPLLPDGDTARFLQTADATPVVHPVFARLFRHTTPFNDLRPIGIGDLKVVRQRLTAYRPGEISHIHNVLKGERKTRTHRRLERTDETFASTVTRGEESSRETQSTQRMEIKKEAEEVVKSQLGITANASVSYKNDMVVATVGAGLSYQRSTDDTRRAAQNFAREVIDKAVQRVTSQTVTQRSTVKRFETEEKNLQTFTNTSGGHLSGMYRWVDKEYTAQVYSYGKRLMFEFLVPQPAEFWIRARLRSYGDTLAVPQPPTPKPLRTAAELPFKSGEIDEAMYDKLRTEYELEHLPYPPPVRRRLLRDATGRDAVFSRKDVPNEPRHPYFAFDCVIDGAQGYQLTKAITYWQHTYRGDSDKEHPNGFTLFLDQRRLYHKEEAIRYWHGNGHTGPPEEAITFTDDHVTFVAAFREYLQEYWFHIELELTRPQALYEKWQRNVYHVVLAAEQKRLDDDFAELRTTYQAELAEYQDRIDQVKAVTVDELLGGRPSGANRQIMDEEIKKHCLTLITKEFDTDASDDLLVDLTLDALKERTVAPWHTSYEVKEAQNLEGRTAVQFTHEKGTEMKLPTLAIAETRGRGRIVQFLEQAFEWPHLSYLCYPYFWAEMPRWIELMNRSDDTDPDFAAFLRAGMARVLVAVTPGYEDAVLHYLATREPWSGGPTPVIGDPLFLPLHDEIRKHTDDLRGGEPEGDPWTYTVPTTLVHLHHSEDPLPDLSAENERGARS
ncbi:hypothetical protein [Streptomyces griseorubiginosus]|uniref:hypothetical protein n=1 Tax=Streptomyces griseorubiginosus TaxID=67304 RepID=UPI002E813ED0|nr:hypothetical protein [Streptomyces griseorubiginosus]WUB48480.1 hypothetical protein OHN19_36125 [Streptomyces griseorubiginosus]WUB57006.1 hypothetical protein OG942_36135 [Streptomyces griseorubiginosus]